MCLVLTVAGCGGGGDEAKYVEAYQGACSELTAGIQQLTSDAQAAGRTDAKADPAKALPQIRTAVVRLYTVVDRSLTKMAAAEAPSDFSDFQDALHDNVDSVTKDLATARARVSGAKTLAEFEAAQEAIGNLGSGLEKVKFPAALKEKAPACRNFGS